MISYCPRVWHGNALGRICLSVCLSVCPGRALTFESLDVHSRVVGLPLKGNLVLDVLRDIKAAAHSIVYIGLQCIGLVLPRPWRLSRKRIHSDLRSVTTVYRSSWPASPRPAPMTLQVQGYSRSFCSLNAHSLENNVHKLLHKYYQWVWKSYMSCRIMPLTMIYGDPRRSRQGHLVILYSTVVVCQLFNKPMIDWLIDWLDDR